MRFLDTVYDFWEQSIWVNYEIAAFCNFRNIIDYSENFKREHDSDVGRLLEPLLEP